MIIGRFLWLFVAVVYESFIQILCGIRFFQNISIYVFYNRLIVEYGAELNDIELVVLSDPCLPK
jgi:hypothetical protein